MHTVSVYLSVDVISLRERKYIVTCNVTGGTLTSGSLTGPGLTGEGLQLMAVGSVGRRGQNIYSATTDLLTLSGDNGDTYTCSASNRVSSSEIRLDLTGNNLYSLQLENTV